MSQPSNPPVTEITPDGIPAQQPPPVPVTPPAPSPAAEPPKPTAEVKPPVVEKPAETKEEVNYDDFLEAAGKVAKTVEQAPVKKEEVKPVAAKPDAAKPTEEQKPADQQDKRDYSDIPEELQPVFKRLHNDPFNTLKPIVKEHKALKSALAEKDATIEKLKKGGVPENYFEHPRAFILTPEFERAGLDAERANYVYNHWKQQAERIRSGEATYNELLIDQQGNFVVGKSIAVDKASEKLIDGYVDWSRGQLQEYQYNIKKLADSHLQTHQTAVKDVQSFEAAAFSQFKTEESKQWEPIVLDTIRKTLPPMFHGNPLASGYAKALLTIQQLGNVIKHLQGQTATTKTVKTDDGKVISLDDQRKAGPTSSDLGGGAVTTGKKAADEDVTMDDFERIKKGY